MDICILLFFPLHVFGRHVAAANLGNYHRSSGFRRAMNLDLGFSLSLFCLIT